MFGRKFARVALVAAITIAIAGVGGGRAEAALIATKIDVHGPYELQKEVVGVGAYLGWESGSGGCGYGGCQSLYSPLEGRTLHFYAWDSWTELCSAVTGADGIARCGSVAEKLAVIAGKGIKVLFEGDDTYQSASASVYRALV